MRGDRPLPVTPEEFGLVAPPHARGSTHTWGGPHRRPGGSPACAGIDLLRDPMAGDGGWLPRMRGDRPSMVSAKKRASAAPPHARGSTRLGCLPCHPRRGSPACAGIDQPTRMLYKGRPRLPRMRGDRPLVVLSGRNLIRAPPHARGSTPAWLVIQPDGRGSPACAGIDLLEGRLRPSARRLPRMRGDRP